MALALAWGLAMVAPDARAQSRGELLYNTHCLSCHTTKMHWRDQRAVQDWPGLKRQVQRWQAAALLDWAEDDVLEVARHLNDTVYRFDRTGAPRSSATPGQPTAARLVPGRMAGR